MRSRRRFYAEAKIGKEERKSRGKFYAEAERRSRGGNFNLRISKLFGVATPKRLFYG
jgi:hypothetical protein